MYIQNLFEKTEAKCHLRELDGGGSLFSNKL